MGLQAVVAAWPRRATHGGLPLGNGLLPLRITRYRKRRLEDCARASIGLGDLVRCVNQKSSM